VENFPFPGIMWHEKKNKENKNEKIPGYTAREEGKNPQQRHYLRRPGLRDSPR
jgi:hypothetical protein